MELRPLGGNVFLLRIELHTQGLRWGPSGGDRGRRLVHINSDASDEVLVCFTLGFVWWEGWVCMNMCACVCARAHAHTHTSSWRGEINFRCHFSEANLCVASKDNLWEWVLSTVWNPRFKLRPSDLAQGPLSTEPCHPSFVFSYV